jgi:hypothetical protein
MYHLKVVRKKSILHFYNIYITYTTKKETKVETNKETKKKQKRDQDKEKKKVKRE